MEVYRNDSVLTFDYTESDMRSLYSMFEYGRRHSSDKAQALYYFGTRINYAELFDLVDSFAAGLVRLGIKKGDFVSIFLPNIPQCVIAVYAINRIGAVCNLIHPLSTRQELEHCITLTESRYVLAFEMNEGLCEGLGALVIRCKIGAFFPKSVKGRAMKAGLAVMNRNTKKIPSAVRFGDILEDGRKFLFSGGKLPEDTVQADDVAAVMYTGGTTGEPKGVLLSNKAINISTSEIVINKLSGKPHIGIKFLSILPVFHAFGLSIVIHAPLSGGMSAYLVPSFAPKSCAKLILDEKIDILPGVPAMFEKMYPYFKGKNLSFVQHIVTGGDKVSPDLVRRYKPLSGTELLPGYGLTEVCGCCMLTPTGLDEFPEGCIGKPLRYNKICLVEPGTTNVIPNTEEGELCISGPILMKGYYKNPEATADVMKVHDDGLTWVHTGDIVTINAQGNLIFKSRYKRMIKVNGYNVYPSVIENTMEKCPAIDQVCAVGMPWRGDDTRIKLFVTLAFPSTSEEESVAEIKKYAAEHLNRWNQPKVIRVLPSMPMTKMSKVDYRLLETME
ncbi:MAG TPA: class I adenylate-forming enzyme family protein [Methanocorpusculum sp.]|nr:class I adenylate-forming enzyme family protein [Methanocorpusculum sp.]